MSECFDILIIGAGLSGIGTACQLAAAHPAKRIGILERRQSIGGTWDLFRYPGIRSDSDMCSFGYQFRPWNELKVLADGSAIRDYIVQTAREYRVEEKIQFGFKTTDANWSSRERCWNVNGVHEVSGESRSYQTRFLISCTGYYNHDAGFLPKFPGVENFKGQCIHPQHWPENLDYAGKKVVVIGSGATAVTLVPAMAPTAGHVTMLQRSPSYIFSVPAYDKITSVLQKILPSRWAFGLARKRNILVQRWLYQACKRRPAMMRDWLLSQVRKHVGPDVDMRHFTPQYMPWDERLCAVPNADLFHALRDGTASMATDEIDRFTETGIRLKSGMELEADIVVTATGLELQMLGGIELRVDGQVRRFNEQMTYKGVLIQNLPNLAWIFGYTNAPWTLKSDLSARYLARLLRHMDERGLEVALPHDANDCALDDGMLDSLKSGYVQRRKNLLPRQGRTQPWQVRMHYPSDRRVLLKDPIEDGLLRFEPVASNARAEGDAFAQTA